ncbi:MAG: hypothetical protein ACLRMJ_07025 [Alistipes finegoldii]
MSDRSDVLTFVTEPLDGDMTCGTRRCRAGGDPFDHRRRFCRQAD